MRNYRTRIRRPRWTRSKTQTFGVALIVLGALQANMGIFTNLLSEETIGYIASGIGIAVYILRAYTTTSLADKYFEGSRNIDSPDGDYYNDGYEDEFRGPRDY